MPEQFLNEVRMPVADGSSDVGDVSALTPRERQVLAQIMAGASNKEAGRTLGNQIVVNLRSFIPRGGLRPSPKTGIPARL